MSSIDKFLEDILPDSSSRQTLIEALREIYSRRRRRILIFQGTGSNGRTTLIEVIQKALGTLFHLNQVPLTDFYRERLSVSFHNRTLLQNRGQRLVWGIGSMLDPYCKDSGLLNETLEFVIGNKPIEGRVYYRKETFVPTFSLVLTPYYQLDLKKSLRQITTVIDFPNKFSWHPSPKEKRAIDFKSEIPELASQLARLLSVPPSLQELCGRIVSKKEVPPHLKKFAKKNRRFLDIFSEASGSLLC